MYTQRRISQRVPAPSPWVPQILPEETFFSYVTRAQRLAVTPTTKQLNHVLFGRGHKKRPYVHLEGEEGADSLETRMKPFGVQFDRGALEQHSLRALAQPFRPSANRTPGFSFHQESHHWCNERGMRSTLLRSHPAFCPDCTAQDIHNMGFSYWRRTPQVVGVNFCPEHLTGIVDRCMCCGALPCFDELPDPNCNECGLLMSSQHAFNNTNQDRVALKFASAIEAVFNGRISGPLDTKSARDHFHTNYPKRQPLMGADWCDHVISVAGPEYLSELGLEYSSRHKVPWPTLIYADDLTIGQASHQLLLYAALTFEFPNEDLFLAGCPRDANHLVTDNLDTAFKALWAKLNQPRQTA